MIICGYDLCYRRCIVIPENIHRAAVSAADLLKQLYRKGLPGQVELFKARTDLSIGSYLFKHGLGDSKNLWLVLVEAEQAMSRSGLVS